MILIGKILNSDATLNSYKELSSLDFMPGATMTLNIMLFNNENGIRYVLPSTAVTSVIFPTANGIITKTASFLNAGDRSLLSVLTTSDDTLDMSGGNFTFSIDVLGDGTNIILGYVQGALRRIISGEPE